MTKQKPCAHSKNTPSGAYEFKGLTDWFEVFRAGENTDSKGNKKTWTQADLDTMVENHNAEQPAPFVVGHPKTDDPAYGWTSELKRDGDILLAKGADIVPEFESAVEAKQFRNRSVSIIPVNDGYQLRHIGFLGAVAPAVPGLKDIAFNEADNAETYEFAAEVAIRGMGWRFGSIARVFRSLKNKLIADQGVEAADQVFPEYMLDELNETSSIIQAELKTDSHFSADDGGDPINHANPEEDADMNKGAETFSKQQVEDLVAAAVQKAIEPLQTENSKLKGDAEDAAFNARVNDAKAFVDDHVSQGKVLPAQAVGMVEFMASLSDQEDKTFEFSVGEGDKAQTQKVTPLQFAKNLIGGLGKQIEFNKRSDAGNDLDDKGASQFSGPVGLVVDEASAELDRKALEYSKTNNVDYTEALMIVSQED